MRNLGFNRMLMIVVASAALIMPATVARTAVSESPISALTVFAEGPPTVQSAGSLKDNSTYYTVRSDQRRCMSPMCGGYFVKSVNDSLTRCANGKSENECYVAEIDWNGQPDVDPSRALLRGELITKTFDPSAREFGVLRVTEAWRAVNDKKPEGTFYRVRDKGLRCIAAPCPTHQEAKLNSNAGGNVAGVDLSGAGASDDQTSEAFKAMTGRSGILVVGVHSPVTGPAGRMDMIKVTQFYLRGEVAAANPPPNLKPCIKTGCSSQVCSDRNVITTCIWRAEYECYQKATCERQADGNCGFTKTPQLTACLRKK